MKKIFLVLFIGATTMSAQDIRPIRDNIGFCWTAGEMDRVISYLDSASDQTSFSSNNLIGAISPHDDYLYAGKIYYPLYKLIKAKEIVVFGVTPGTFRRAMGDPKNVLIIDEFKEWQGPYRKVEISPLREKLKAAMPDDFKMVSNKAQSIEHSIEALIPFLQRYNRNIKITPIMVTQMPLSRMDAISDIMVEAVKSYIKAENLELGKDIFFLISNDANHYGEDFDNSPYGLDLKAHQAGTANDRRILTQKLTGKVTSESVKNLRDELWGTTEYKTPPLWCGRYPIIFGMTVIRKLAANLYNKSVTAKLFRYSDTLTEKTLPIQGTSLGTTAVFSPKHWVGFFSAGFYLE